jgi:uncharacterized protein (TIGR02246 family)
MTRYANAFFAALLTLAISACAGQPAPMDTSAEMPKIDALRNQFLTAFNAGDVPGILATYTDDAVVMAPNNEPMTGRQAIQAYYEGFFGQFTPHLELTPTESLVLGPDWALDRGGSKVTLTPKTGGEAMNDAGKYLVLLKKQADGSWKVARDIDNSNTPPPAMPMAMPGKGK